MAFVALLLCPKTVIDKPWPFQHVAVILCVIILHCDGDKETLEYGTSKFTLVYFSRYF